MARAILESLGLFAVPFLLSAAFLVYRARHPLVVEHWSQAALSWLTFLGLALAISGLVAAGVFAPRSSGAYVPARIENGVLTPGHFQ